MTRAGTAWAGFWREETAAASGATLASLPPPLQQLLDEPWRKLAQQLPAKAKILDLATGGGGVLEMLRRGRRDLKLLGVDSAPALPKRPGMELRGGISTEHLPFADGRFCAVTSRFGIEYGHLEIGACEASRVLRRDGLLCMIVHHEMSNVVRHNRARREALVWAARSSGWVQKAMSVSAARKTLNLPTPPAFASAAADAAARFPGQSSAWEFLTGLNQLLDAGAPEQQVATLAERAEGEISRIDALLAAACGNEKLEQITATLVTAGLVLEKTRTIDEPGGTPMAWHIAGRKQ